jgi:superfamily II DNA or RNA helicase
MDYARPRAKPQPVVEHLYFLSEDKQEGFFPAGLLPDVQRYLQEHGLKFLLADHRDLAHLFPQPDFSVLDPLRDGQEEVILALCQNDRGIIVCSTGFGKSFIVRQLCKMYPGLKIVITTPGRDDVRNMWSELNAIMPARAVGMIGGGRNDSPNHRITVCTNKSLKKADLEHCDLFIFDEVHACGHNDVADCLAWVRNARMYGFTASPKGRSDNAEKVIEALFGNVIAEFNYREAMEKGLVAPIEVWEYTAGGRPIDAVMQASKRRWGYWRNKERNRLIADVAGQFPEDEQVLILVETIEHLMYLKKLLPEFTAM